MCRCIYICIYVKDMDVCMYVCMYVCVWRWDDNVCHAVRQSARQERLEWNGASSPLSCNVLVLGSERHKATGTGIQKNLMARSMVPWSIHVYIYYAARTLDNASV